MSDYYTVGVGETVFQNDSWWKAIVNVTEKGTYETNEVMVYLWQNQDGEWRRRQKYAVKNISDWEEKSEVIDQRMSVDAATSGVREGEGVSSDLSTLEDELSAHLSDEFR